MRCSLIWAICSLLCLQSAVGLAQQSRSPIQPNYGRTTKKVALHELPSPAHSMAPIGSGVSTVIPQQGNVDLGNTPSLPSYSYSSTPSTPSYSSAPSSSAPSYSAPAVSAPISSGPLVPAPAAASSCSSCETGGYAASAGYGSADCAYCGSAGCLGGCRLKHGKHGKFGLGHLLGAHGRGAGIGGGGWFGGLYYMRLFRADDSLETGRPIAFNDTDASQIALSTGQASTKGMDGMGIRLGKMINPCTAIEFIYWQLFPNDVTAFNTRSFLGAGITAPLNFGSLTYDSTVGPGAVPVSDFFTDADYMSVTRSYDYRNFEFNFLRLPFMFGGNSCSRARLAFLAGPRYFRATESLRIFADDLNEIPGDDPLHELQYESEVENHMVGFQVGTLLDYRVTNRLSAQLGTKAGIYNNRMKHTQLLSGGAGGAVIGAGPFAGQTFALETKKDDVAFLGELDAGASYCLSQNFRVTGGYKLIGISGFADSTSQMPLAFDNLATSGLIYDNDSLILHGFYIGAEFCW